jgi:hypothetical protein
MRAPLTAVALVVPVRRPFKSAPFSVIIYKDNDEKWAGRSPFFFAAPVAVDRGG